MIVIWCFTILSKNIGYLRQTGASRKSFVFSLYICRIEYFLELRHSKNESQEEIHHVLGDEMRVKNSFSVSVAAHTKTNMAYVGS